MQTTGLTGLNVVLNPHHMLSVAYGRIARVLNEMPDESAYKKHTMSIVSERIEYLKSVSIHVHFN